MRTLLIFAFLSINFSIFSQEDLSYTCTQIDKKDVKLKITNASRPLDYQKIKVYIVKFDLIIKDSIHSTFYTYKYGGKQYIVAGNMSKINPTSDNILFELPQKSYTQISHSQGIWAGVRLVLDKFYTINDQDFYIYNNNSPHSGSFSIGQVIFDKNLNITELQIRSKTGKCSCTKKKIVIRLK